MARPPKRGATAARARPPGRLRLWLQNHVQTMVASLGRLWRAPFASLMTILVIGVALAMPAILQMLVQNARAATGSWDSAVDLSVYLDVDIEAERRDALVATLQARADITELRIIDAQSALADFRAHSGFGDALDALETNPLPTTLVVTPAPAHRDTVALDTLARALGDLDGVNLVQLDTEWVKRFHGMLDVVRRAALLAGALLAIAVLVIVGNTIRMEILNRREEIEIVKLIGASDSFIRRPFLYSGLWYGLGGGLAAALLVLLITGALRGPVANLAGLYGSEFALIGMTFSQFATLTAAGGALGLIGSWIATTRHMRRIEPT